MDTLEATNKVLTRIQAFDPHNASKIMGYILIQDHGDKDIIRLAHGPDSVLLALIKEAKAFLGLSSNTSPASLNLGPFSQRNVGFHPDSRRLLHGVSEDVSLDEFLRLKALQKQRLSAVVDSSCRFPFTHHNCVGNLNENPRLSPASLIITDEIQRFGLCQSEACDFPRAGFDGCSNPCSRQIYLTFPADSKFTEEDVSNYFNTYGPVQDVRIPYQQKRMFGFVTFAYPETVKQILAKGNPHFVCDSRVLVKPYKEKGKVLEKKWKLQHHHMDFGKFSACLSPSGLDHREHCGLPYGPRMFNSSRKAMLSTELEQGDELQEAIELHSRSLMNLQLLDPKNKENQNQFQACSSPIVSGSQSLTHKVTAQNTAGQEGELKNNSLDDLELYRRGLKAPENPPGPTKTDDMFAPNQFSDNTPTLPDTPSLSVPSLQPRWVNMSRITSDQEAIEV